MNKTQIKTLIDIAIESGNIALKYFESTKLEINKKSDNSPVTKADKEVSSYIASKLKEHFGDISIICEEGHNREIKGDKFWLIDPIDGTKEFIKKTPYFTVNIALIENNIPVFGIIYAPKFPNSPLYYVDENQNLKCYLVKTKKFRKLKDVKESQKITKVMTSKRSKDFEVRDFLRDNFKKIDIDNIEIIKMSSSVKFCEMVENKADLFLSLKQTMEWDTGAGNALILAAKGKVLNLQQKTLYYNKDKFINDGFIVSF